ncbi:hypothetical protein FRC20_006147 [Serendipita sp. 405]|nr:hypothetical protein FRC20_006147 [Serendipita sp. 405]
MHPALPRTMARLRIVFYVGLALWSSLSITFNTLRLVYTMSPRKQGQIPSDDDGQPFYDPFVAELWLTSVLTLPYSLVMLFIILKSKRFDTLSRNWFELTMLFLLWSLWLGGICATTVSKTWSNLSYCVQSVQCNHQMALLAFAWLDTIFLTCLLLPALFHVSRTRTWDQHVVEQWTKPNPIGDGRATSYIEQKAGSEANAIRPWTYQVESRIVSYRVSSLSDVLPWLAWSDSQPSHAPSILDPASTNRRASGPIRVTFSDAQKV